MYDEANFVVERDNGRIVTEAILIQLAAASILSDKARKEFTKRTQSLSFEVRAIPDDVWEDIE